MRNKVGRIITLFLNFYFSFHLDFTLSFVNNANLSVGQQLNPTKMHAGIYRSLLYHTKTGCDVMQVDHVRAHRSDKSIEGLQGAAYIAAVGNREADCQAKRHS